MKLSDLCIGERCYINKITSHDIYTKTRLEEYGFIKNATIEISHISPGEDLIMCNINDNYISITISEAQNIIVTPIKQKKPFL